MRFQTKFAAAGYTTLSVLSGVGLLTVPAAMCTAAQTAPATQPALIALSQDAVRYAALAPDNHVEIRSRANPAAPPTFSIRGPGEPVTALAFSADGTVLAVGSSDRYIRLYDTTTGKRINELRLPREPKEKLVSRIGALAFNANGTELAATDTGYGWILRYRGVQPASLEYKDAAVVGVPLSAFASDNKGAWVGGDTGGRFHFYDSSLREVGATGSKIAGAIRSLAVSPDSRFLASGGDDAQIKLWGFGGAIAGATNASTFPLTDRFPATATLISVVFRADGQAVLGVDVAGQFKEWNYAASGQPVVSTTTLPVVTPPVTVPPVTPPPVVPPVVAVTPPVNPPRKNTPVAVVPRRPVPPPVVRPKLTVSLLRRLVGHSENINTVVFSPDGRLLASGSRDKTVRLWNVEDGTPRALLGKHANFVSALAFAPDGSRLVSGGWDNKILLWDPATGKEIADPLLEKHTSYVLSLDFSPDGTRLASGSNDRTARLYGFGDGTKTSKVTSLLTEGVAAVAFSPDGTRLAGGCIDGRVFVWDGQSLQVERKMTAASPALAVYCLTWLDNDTLVTAGKGGTLRVWNVRTGKPIGAFTANTSDVYGLTFDPAHKILASGGGDKLVHLWAGIDVKSGKSGIKPVAQGQGHTDTVRTLAFSGNGQMLASGGWDYNILLWRVAESGGSGVAAAGDSESATALMASAAK